MVTLAMLATSILMIGKFAALLAAAAALAVYGGIALYILMVWRDERRGDRTKRRDDRR